MTKEEIQARIDKSNLKLKERREAEENKRQGVKLGVAFVHENRIPLMTKRLEDGSVLTLGAMRVRKNTFAFAFSLCSSKDRFSLRISKGLIGQRFLSGDPLFTFVLDDLENEDSQSVLTAGHIGIQLEALKGNKNLPDRLRRAIREELIDSWQFTLLE